MLVTTESAICNMPTKETSQELARGKKGQYNIMNFILYRIFNFHMIKIIHIIPWWTKYSEPHRKYNTTNESPAFKVCKFTAVDV